MRRELYRGSGGEGGGVREGEESYIEGVGEREGERGREKRVI